MEVIEWTRSLIPDHLLKAYCMMRDPPDEKFGLDASRKRYGNIEALLAGIDDANAEMERLVPSKPIGSSAASA